MKKILILIVMLAIVIPNYAQKRNKQGLKMVSELKVRWFNSEGEAIAPWKSWDVSYYYDENGKLTQLTKSFQDYGQKYKYVYKLSEDEREVSGVVYIDGKLYPKEKITICLGQYAYTLLEKISEEYGTKSITVCFYNSFGKVYQAGFRAYYKQDYSNKLEYVDFVKNTLLSGHRNGSLKNYEKRFNGVNCFNRVVIDKEDSIYECNEDIERCEEQDKFLVYIGGNMHNVKQINIGHKDFVYSNRSNDTNIEFYGLTANEYSPFYNIEWTSEWINTRSKNLIEGEDVSNKKYTREWSYMYDAYGNLKTIKVSSSRQYCMIDIKYVCIKILIM